jgi:hypothetical protein
LTTFDLSKLKLSISAKGFSRACSNASFVRSRRLTTNAFQCVALSLVQIKPGTPGAALYISMYKAINLSSIWADVFFADGVQNEMTRFESTHVAQRAIGLPTIATARLSHVGELGANTGTGGAFGRLPNDPTFQEVDWHRIGKGQFGMPTTKVKKRKSK